MNIQSVNELKNALAVSSSQGRNVAVLTTQEAVRGVLFEVEQLDELNKKYHAQLIKHCKPGVEIEIPCPELTDEQKRIAYENSPVPQTPWRDYGKARQG